MVKGSTRKIARAYTDSQFKPTVLESNGSFTRTAPLNKLIYLSFYRVFNQCLF